MGHAADEGGGGGLSAAAAGLAVAAPAKSVRRMCEKNAREKDEGGQVEENRGSASGQRPEGNSKAEQGQQSAHLNSHSPALHEFIIANNRLLAAITVSVQRSRWTFALSDSLDCLRRLNLAPRHLGATKGQPWGNLRGPCRHACPAQPSPLDSGPMNLLISPCGTYQRAAEPRRSPSSLARCRPSTSSRRGPAPCGS